MPPRKERIPVVIDTNLFITRFLHHKRSGLNRRVIDLWQARRRLQLIVSQTLVQEYLYVLENYIFVPPKRLKTLEKRLATASYVTNVNLGKRFYLSRDLKDNMLIDTAHVGNAKFLITRDKDLLEISKQDLKGFRFEIVTPFEFLERIGEI